MKHWMMLSLLLGLLIGLTALLAPPAPAYQKEKKVKKATTKAVEAKTQGEEDPNIKASRGENKRAAKEAAPPKKGGAKRRGGVGEIHVDNRTGWYVDIYVDGIYRGTVSPYGDWYRFADAGSFRLYGRAEFDDGSALTWGPTTLAVYDEETSTWTLTN